MADAVPVSDVLCEATEYLSKLGSNLRVRTENLKDKRIRKDKLQNVHAVRKAASKVLLICELSKKSIENVETGIEKILAHLSASQTSEDGGKRKKGESSKSEDSTKFEHIVYNSRKLKIRKKVNLKHYMSVNVKATALSDVFQDKYPVYHDCKLYRMRKRKDKAKSKEIDNVLDGNQEENPDTNVSKTDDVDHMSGTDTPVVDSEIEKSKEIDNVIDGNQAEDPDTSVSKTDDVDHMSGTDTPVVDSEIEKNKNCKELLLSNSIEGDKDNVNDESDKQCTSVPGEDECSSQNIDTDLEKEVPTNTESNDEKLSDWRKKSKTSKANSKHKTKEKSKKTKFKHIKVFDDSSDSDKGSVKSNSATENLGIKDNSVQNSSITESVVSESNALCDKEGNENQSDVENNEMTVDTSAKQCNEDKNINNDGENNSDNELENYSETENPKKKSDKIHLTDNSNIENPVKENLDNVEENQEENTVCENKEQSDSSSHQNENSEMKAETRPLIKCVNISKLLKVDYKTKNESLLEISDNENEKDKHKQKKPKSSNNKNKHGKQEHKIKEKLDKNKKSTTSDDDDEEYWKEKRKEVKKFISKKFHISITRMPKLSEKYLAAHHIVRVIQNGVVVSEHSTTLTSKDSITNSDVDKNPKEMEKAICDMDVVKNALLNDSDSDKSDSELMAKTKQTIDDYLNNSKPDNGDNEKASNNKSLSGNDTEELDANNTNHMDKQKTPEPEVQKSKSDIETEIVKSSLMKDSSDESLEKSDSKKRRKSDSITPSKRKHIMESMHAKKMLLTYSSSSDTEDEQLRNALKEIRNSLLQESIDEPKKSNEESVSEEKRKSDKSQSASEGSEIDTKKKMKELESKETKDKKKSETEENNQSESSAESSKRHAKGSTEENSNSSSKKIQSDGNGSSNINSDIEDQIDKDIDGLTNLKTLNKRQRRRRSSSSEESQTHKTRSKMPKAPQITKETFLKAESSSDEASAVESDVPGEEMPTVPASGLNGDAISHLAKDDLLGDSDDTSSEKDASQQDQNNDSSDENVTTKRRKANAILSDTEGEARKKDRDVKMSDFEDSEDESSEPAKRSKRKNKGTDSDASVSSSIDGTKKKRKRIKNIDDSDEGSGSESETEGKNKHGRKNIRKVMGKNQLEEATKKAAREEKERIARIVERQKLYNNLEFDETGKPDEVVLDKVVLDFDPETKEPLIEVDKGLVKKLKPHQANGIKFMWNACFESVKRIKKDKGSGCILAHCMGLGKTLQVVSLTHTLLTHGDLTGVRRVLVVCPLSTVLNWVNEFRMWLKHTHSDYELDVYELSRYKQNSERAYQLHQWFTGGGVCVLGYEMFRNLSADNVKKFKKKMLRNFQESLVDPGPDLVVCDEGHLLKNEKTSLSQAMNRICTLRRIVLTGTPLQNNLKEYYCMVQFVKPNLLGKYNEYLNRFVNPITNGQYTDSTEHDIRIMKRRSHVLHKMLDGAVQRRDYGVLAPFLPPKHEYVLFITLTDVQIKLYQEYLDNYSRRPSPGKSSGFLFPDFQSLQRIWTHPLVLKYNSERYEIMQQKKREREEEDSEGSLVDFIDDDSTPDESTTEESTDDSSDMSDDSRKKSKKKKSSKKAKGKEGKAGARRGTRANPLSVEVEEEEPVVEEAKAENPTEWWIRMVGDEELEDLRNSHKLVLLFDILRQCDTIGDKLLVFSQSLYSLDLIEHFLGKVDEATQEGRVDEKLNGHVGSWSPGVDYFRLDGSTSCENRSIWCKNFNREDNPRARLFLISTRAGGLGINLVAANRVVIFDVSWNPSHDVQSIFRVYRFGQKKPCYVYRFLAMGTMEEKIYERQVTKQAISKRVIDEQQIDRHYAENDLAELYKFEPRPEAPRELPPLPKDRLFAEMLREHEAQIYKYHEHDSLLENKEEETLTEEERKAAWEDFENEKTRPPPAPFPGPYGMHNGMVPGLLAQQQQLAYAALASMLRKDMPNINDNQIRDMLPLIYQANPGLMQKMSEIYKYAQPGMMNPGMMNPAMNTGGGAMAMGGSSGLQYEPPWQRQQQQQQQMRLQQLLQQQQNMGAKFYAGGLGSRDPVAMALQQQRAREMMLGEQQRPRGRPPARAAQQPSGDVVNLDSD